MLNEKKMKPLPIWEPQGCKPQLVSGLQFDAPFIFTKEVGKNDIGHCAISTFPPHFVFKLHGFRGIVKGLPELAEKNAQRRLKWLQQRAQAIENGMEAMEKGITIRELIESKGKVYDEELDEPRVVVKIPGLNAYFELLGCLDKFDLSKLVWTGENGLYRLIKRLQLWGQNVWDFGKRKEYASKKNDIQPLNEWQEDYNPFISPVIPRPRGIGHTYIDPSRRDDYLHSISSDKDVYEMERTIREAEIEAARHGIAPENYGKR